MLRLTNRYHLSSGVYLFQSIWERKLLQTAIVRCIDILDLFTRNNHGSVYPITTYLNYRLSIEGQTSSGERRMRNDSPHLEPD